MKTSIYTISFAICGLITLCVVHSCAPTVKDNEPTAVVEARKERGAAGLSQAGYDDVRMGDKIDGTERCGNFKHAVRYSATLPDGTKDTGVYCTND